MHKGSTLSFQRFVFACFLLLFCCCFFVVVVLGLYPWHMEVPRLGVESKLQLPAYTTATAMWDPSHICDLQHSSRQRQILNHSARPGIEPVSSWMLVRFASTAPQQELQDMSFFLQPGLTSKQIPSGALDLLIGNDNHLCYRCMGLSACKHFYITSLQQSPWTGV